MERSQRRWLDQGGLLVLLVLLVAVVAVAAVIASGGTDTVAGASEAQQVRKAESVQAAAPYALAPTLRCLRTRGATMTRITARQGRLKALADLAQKTSYEVRRNKMSVAIAFGNSALLAELLRVPGSRYRLEPRANVLLMYLPAARQEAAVVRGCLRR